MKSRSAPNSLWMRTGCCECSGCNKWFGLWDLVFDGKNVWCLECADKRNVNTVSLPKYNEPTIKSQ